MGEAKNPGPLDCDLNICDGESVIRFTVVNPTAVYNKIDDLVELHSNCLCLAETSATQAVQDTTSISARQNNYRIFWSSPVASQRSFEYDRPIYRGESRGTACMTNLPSRPSNISLPPDLDASSRVMSCVVRLGCFDVLVFSFYGLTGSSLEARKANDYLLASIYHLATQVRTPVLVGGDFNVRPEVLPSYELFARKGFMDAFSFFEKTRGYSLPPTCSGKTRNDTFLIDPVLMPYIHDIHVVEGCIFDKHSPLSIDFKLPRNTPEHFQWKMPKSWRDLGTPKPLIQAAYERHFANTNMQDIIQDGEINFAETMTRWSKFVEKVVGEAVRDHHQMDPVTQTYTTLPRAYQGRCIDRKRVKVVMNNPTKYSEQGYNPSNLAFSTRVKQKTKQVRRLEGLYRSMHNFFTDDRYYPDYGTFCQWKTEWHAILGARGYGNSWQRWILGFESIPCVPTVVPKKDFVYDALQITRHDCEIAAKKEQQLRQDSYHLKMAFDRTDNFLRGTYRILKDLDMPPVNNVTVTKKCNACLCRSSHGRLVVRIAQGVINLHPNREIHFGDCVAELIEQKGDIVILHHTMGHVPTQGILFQHDFACTPVELCDAFEQFWAPLWQRDTVEEERDSDRWTDLNAIIDQVDVCIPEIKIDLTDPQRWVGTIKKLKKNKAIGYDGWHNEDLQSLPDVAIHHLSQIFQKLWGDKFDHQYMQARVILLSKIKEVQHMGHCRPVTILGTLYRLATKIIADQLLEAWSFTLPPTISGGVPRRGARMLMYTHQCKVEQCIMANQPVGGFVLDLIKAFNCIPRKPLKKMFIKMGTPEMIIDFWLESLTDLTRLPQIGPHLGEPVSSTTGVPEGDAMSVCSMVVLSFFYHQYLGQNLLQVRITIYADNWSWLTKSQRENFKALQYTLGFVAATRMGIDFNKSWAWANGAEFKKSLDNLQLLLPNGEYQIPVVQNARELGVLVKYSRKGALGPLASKIQGARARLQKLTWISTSFETKGKLIQTSVWPFCFFGAEGTGIGEAHFTKLRRAVANVFASGHKQASSWIANSMLLGSFQDPLLYIICNCVCLLRQLAECDQSLAQQVLKTAWTYHVTHTYGPGTALRFYIEKAGWYITMDGEIGHQNLSLRKINFFHLSPKEIRRELNHLWGLTVMVQSQHRKGIPIHRQFHPKITHEALREFMDSELKSLYINVTGGYLSGVVKKRCYDDNDGVDICPFCNATDTKWHRLIECPKFERLRQKHGDAVHSLMNHYPEWVWHPCAYQHDMVDFLKIFLEQKRELPFEPITSFADGGPLYFFTDGSCVHSHDPHARRAGFAVIQDVSSSEGQRLQALHHFHETNQIPDVFLVNTISHTAGPQTPARSELMAVVRVLETVAKQNLDNLVVIHTDASYVFKAVRWVQKAFSMDVVYKNKNADLLKRLSGLWNADRHSLVKIKAHTEIQEGDTIASAWNKLGNAVADAAAKSILTRENPQIIALSNDIATYNKTHCKVLKTVLKYMSEYNMCHMQELNKQQSQNVEDEQTEQPPKSSVKIIYEWQVPQKHEIFSRILVRKLQVVSLGVIRQVQLCIIGFKR